VRKLFLSLIVVSSVALLAGSFSVYAQKNGGEVVAKIAFEFKAGDKTLPAGSYKITRRSASAPSLVISPEKGGENTILPVITRLAQSSLASTEKTGNLVFDNVGGTRVLSEVWMPGQDGFLVSTSKDEEKHEIVVPSAH